MLKDFQRQGDDLLTVCRIDVAGGELTLFYSVNALPGQSVYTEEIDAFLFSELFSRLVST